MPKHHYNSFTRTYINIQIGLFVYRTRFFSERLKRACFSYCKFSLFSHLFALVEYFSIHQHLLHQFPNTELLVFVRTSWIIYILPLATTRIRNPYWILKQEKKNETIERCYMPFVGWIIITSILCFLIIMMLT